MCHNKLYVGGYFQYVGDNDLWVGGITAWNPATSTWEALGGNGGNQAGTDRGVYVSTAGSSASVRNHA